MEDEDTNQIVVELFDVKIDKNDYLYPIGYRLNLGNRILEKKLAHQL